MDVTVRLFAAARECVGRPEVTLELLEPATVAALRSALVAASPGLARVLDGALIAVATEYAGDDRVILPGDEVAVIPPVSGGAPATDPSDDRRP